MQAMKEGLRSSEKGVCGRSLGLVRDLKSRRGWLLRFVVHDAGTFMFSFFCVSKYLVKLVMVMPRISLVFGSLLTRM